MLVWVYLIMCIRLFIHICYVYLYIFYVYTCMYTHMLDAPGSSVPGRDLRLLYMKNMCICLI